MHIAIVAPERIPVPPHLGGSVEICIYAIAKQLATQHQVTVISRRFVDYPNQTQEGNMTIVRLPVESDNSYLSLVIDELKDKRYDIIQVDNRPRFAAKIKVQFPDTPVVLFLHSLTFVSPPFISYSSAASLLKKLDLVICNSASLRHELLIQFPFLKTKLKKIMLGVDLRQFHPSSNKEKLKLKRKYGLNGKFVVLFAGRLIPKKGLSVLIRAVQMMKSSVPNVHLVIAGGTSHKGYTAQLKRQALANDVPATFLGTVPHRDLHQIYWLSDCFVCPSQKHEAFGLVNVEAMASGVPVIASRIGGIGEIVSHGKNGLLVRRYKKPGDFARYLIGLSKNHKLNDKLTKQGIEDVSRKFNWRLTAERMVKLYRRKFNIPEVELFDKTSRK